MAKQPARPQEIVVLRPACGSGSRQYERVVTHKYANGYVTRRGGRTPAWYATKTLPQLAHADSSDPGWPAWGAMGEAHPTKSEALAALAAL